LTELGNRLKETRLEKGMSLDDLQEVTKIQKRYLLGIEEGNYSMMPGPFYVRAFIKQYAEALELNPEELFEEFKAEIPSTFNEDLPEKLSRVQSRKKFSGNSSRFFDILPKILVIAFIIGALAVIWYFWSKYADDNGNEPINNNKEGTSYEQSENLSREDVKKNEPEEEPAKDSEDPDVTDPNDSTDTEEESTVQQEISVIETKGKNTVYELKNTDKFVLKVVSTGETWVNIKDGKGSSLFQGMLKQGETDSNTQDLTNETEAEIKIGKATDTEIYVNDQKLEYAIPPGEKVTQNITIRFTK